MENQKDAIDIWEYIETHHDQEKNRFGNANAITLDNGMTYIYKTLPNGRLLSIDEWFEGYVDLWGTYESGLLYAVKFENTQVGLYEYTNGLASEPTVTLKYSKKQVEDLKVHNCICSPIKVKYDYVYDGNRYWYIELPEDKCIVYNVTKKSIEHKLKVKDKSKLFDSTIIYRFPFAPYRYAIVSSHFVNNLNWVFSLKIIDFIENKSYDLLDANYKNYTIGVIDYNHIAIFAYKFHKAVADIRYDQETTTLEVETLNTSYIDHRNLACNFKLGDLFVKIHWRKGNSLSAYADYSVIKSPFQDEIVINQDYLKEVVDKSFTINHIVSRNDIKNIFLRTEFADYLEKGFAKNEVITLPGNTEIGLLYYSTEENDLKKIECFLNYIYSEIHTKQFVLGLPCISYDVKVHKLEHGKIVTHDVVTGYRYECLTHQNEPKYTQVDYYEHCAYDISITVHIKYSYTPPEKYLIVTDEDISDSEDISLDNLFDMPEETDIKTPEKKVIDFNKYYLQVEE